MGPKEALDHMKADMSPQQIANRSILPSLNTAYYEYGKYTTKRYGDLGGESMFEAIEKLQIKYPGTTILLQRPTADMPFCLFVQTPLMLRVLQTVEQASEIVFMDSTTNLDQLNTSLTTFHTWTPAGAVPIGLAMTATQTIRDYVQGTDPYSIASL